MFYIFLKILNATDAFDTHRVLRHRQKQSINCSCNCGQSQVGLESTVLDLTVTPPCVLRPGMIHEESIVAVIGDCQLQTGSTLGGALRSPGQLRKHYAPKARLVMLAWRDERDFAAQLANFTAAPERTFVIAHTHIPLGANVGRGGLCEYVDNHALDSFLDFHFARNRA